MERSFSNRQMGSHDETNSQGGMVEVIDLAQLDPYSDKMRSIRGAEISMVFQECR